MLSLRLSLLLLLLVVVVVVVFWLATSSGSLKWDKGAPESVHTAFSTAPGDPGASANPSIGPVACGWHPRLQLGLSIFKSNVSET
jgi:hypothetical protein